MDFFVARGRVLALIGRKCRDGDVKGELLRLRRDAEDHKLRLSIPALDAGISALEVQTDTLDS
jgi:hypothetical protein